MAAAHGRRKNEIDVLRTAFWYAEIRSRLQAATAYEIETRLEPEAFGKNAYGDPIHRNKWSKYEVGQYAPSNSLATRVDRLLPGSKSTLNHVLWQVLQMKYAITANADDWLRKLDPAIQQCVFKFQNYAVLRVPTSGRLLLSLEKRAGIDALACLTILLRESSERAENLRSIDIAQAIYRMLLVLGHTARFADFIGVIFNIYRDRIFPLAESKGERLELQNVDFAGIVQLLSALVRRIEPDLNDETTLIRTTYKILDGRYGFELKFALDPPISAKP